MENHFRKFREGIIGIDHSFRNPYGETKKIVYADWTASGRMYAPIERIFLEEIYPYVANTHTETNSTGKLMTQAYHEALHKIKKHVNACPEDVILSSDSGMTGVVNKFQRILGLKIHEKFKSQIHIREEERPVVFITHMEHHSNHTSWLETLADVEIIKPDDNGLVDLEHFAELLHQYRNREFKIAAVTACSNVTGIQTPYHSIARMIHHEGGYCFVDFACSAPYVQIDMHPAEEGAHLDAIYFSPHKFLGGPGSTGILIFHKKLYKNRIPDHPGGGTVLWTNPWGEHRYYDDIESREDGGTPAFLQTIRAALAINLKEEMGVDRIREREQAMVASIWPEINSIPGLHVLEPEKDHRLPVISFYIDGLHYNMGVKLLNDRFGIQVRGGCSCAGTYGHYLLHIEREYSHHVTCLIDQGDFSEKAGWIRMSLHPTNTEEEMDFILDAIRQLAKRHQEWSEDYILDKVNNEISFKNRSGDNWSSEKVSGLFHATNPKMIAAL